MAASCDNCSNFVFDEDDEEYVCMINVDEDDYFRLLESNFKECPYFQLDDEYRIVRKQI